MESVGKRISKPPVRFGTDEHRSDESLESSDIKDKPTPSTTTTPSVVQPAKLPTTVKQPSIPIENHSITNTNSVMEQVLKMLQEQSRKMDAQAVESKTISKKMDEQSTRLDRHIAECIKDRGALQNYMDETRKEIESLRQGCITRSQECVVHIAEQDDKIHANTKQIKQQGEHISLTQARVEHLDTDIAMLKNEVFRLSQHVQLSNQPDKNPTGNPSVMSPTAIPALATVLTPSHGPTHQSPQQLPQATPTCSDTHRFSLFGTQERAQDVVGAFSGNIKTLHPVKFLSQLNTYFENVPMTDNQQLLCAQRRLTGDAQTWYESLIPSPESYAIFRDVFCHRFWSSATQRKIRNEFFRPYQYRRNDGLAIHAMSCIAGVKYLSPPIDQEDMVSTIIQHFSTALGMAIRGRGPRTTNELLSVLTEFEESPSFYESQRDDDRQRPHQQNHQNANHNNSNRYHGRNNENNQRYPQRPNPRPNPQNPQVDQISLSENEEGPRQ